MKPTPKSWIRIDRLFAPAYRILQPIIEPFLSLNKQPAQVFVVVKFFGLGSIVRLLALCEERRIDLDKIVLVTFSSNKEVCSIWGVRGIFIDGGSLWQMIGSSLVAIGNIARLTPALIIDFERGSNLSALFRTVTAWRARCRSVGFEMRNYVSRTTTIHSIRDLSQIGIFLKGIDGLPGGGPPRITEQVETNHKRVIVNINASQLLPERRYPIAGFVALIKSLSATDKELEFVLTGTREERAYVQQVVDTLKLGHVINVAGQWTLAQFARELSECRLFITVDSAPLHLAASMNVATVAIWGPTQPQHFGYQPTSTFHPVSLELHCSPCFLHPRSRPAEACHGEITCMNNLSFTLINAKAIEVLMSAVPSTRDIIFPSKFAPEAVNALV